ncbi:GspE/PulE family protein [Roseiconus lacunae]|uniref:GspE/PulE family protein n=1 Tax=Roseiconus lacunae TaxID=2605694 RepID=A0ABT7PIM9_9BACT|nr:GspE/PulE family protein [Roseiconus lacunae]MCD0458462.1 GspE/PulE family protein [Roseiconus lacunae]MDM4016350.1 GspE/PulE family protein [Roseiconus lacunae]WRQ52047.1 GspE/PulE family protein [Stieleria sp. HD01]
MNQPPPINPSVKSSVNSETAATDKSGSENVAYCDAIFAKAFQAGASDIHFEPFEQAYRVRMRVDGALSQIAAGPAADYPQLSSRVKILSELDIAERRRPQEGRLRLSIENRAVDYRVSSVPTRFGEKIVLRVVDATGLKADLTKLGMTSREAQLMNKATSRPDGMILVTGPTGSGKTTTLYSALNQLNRMDRNVSTIEDPVEFNVFGITQINVRRDLEMDFPQVLRLLLRQDPDVILVGEIRDTETAKTSFQAALTGHMVLSTLHTNDTASAVARLRDMDVEPFLINAALNLIIAQRLVKRICQHCRTPVKVSAAQLKALGISEEQAAKATFCRGQGCTKCNGTGMRGRIAIFEMLDMTDEIRNLIFENGSVEAIKRQAVKDGMRTLRISALSKAFQGVITLEQASLFASRE